MDKRGENDIFLISLLLAPILPSSLKAQSVKYGIMRNNEV